MKLFQLDTHADYSMGAGPLALCVQTLDTLTRSPDVQWNPSQHAAACRLVHDARRLLEVDVLTLAGQVHPRPGVTLGDNPAPARLAALDALMHECRHDRRAPTYADLVKLAGAPA